MPKKYIIMKERPLYVKPKMVFDFIQKYKNLNTSVNKPKQPSYYLTFKAGLLEEVWKKHLNYINFC